MDNEIITLKNSDEKIPIDESFLLIAGPGAGKTTFLVNHIKHVIDESNKLKNGSKILCITFTNVAVDTIKERLVNCSSDVEISTIHSFLFTHVLKPYIWMIKDEINDNLMDISTIKESFPSYSLLPPIRTWYGIKNRFSLSEIFSQLEHFYWDLNEGIVKPKCESYINFSDNFLLNYKTNLWNKGKITPDDILLFSYKILVKKPKILEILRIKFPYVFIDEFQDVCNIQKKIIEMMCEKKTTVGIIGDPAQSIYSFRGAKYGNLKNINLNLKEYEININHRSNDKIVKVLNNVRNDGLNQISLRNDEFLPTIIIGNEVNAYEYLNNIINGPLHVLSYKHKDLNSFQLKINSEEFKYNENYLFELKQVNDNRESIIRHTISALEYFMNLDIKLAMKNFSHAFRNIETDESIHLKKLFELSQEYPNLINMSLKDFYNNFIYKDYPNEISKITRGNIENIYSNIYYSDIVTELKHTQNSFFRTIHGCKGADLDNVLILDRTNTLNYLLNFNIEKITHRVYYVALSRSKHKLFISINNSISNDKIEKLKRIGFNVKILD